MLAWYEEPGHLTIKQGLNKDFGEVAKMTLSRASDLNILLGNSNEIVVKHMYYVTEWEDH